MTDTSDLARRLQTTVAPSISNNENSSLKIWILELCGWERTKWNKIEMWEKEIDGRVIVTTQDLAFNQCKDERQKPSAIET